MNYNLTESQKSLIKWIVQEVGNGHLPEEFFVAWVMGGKGYIISEYQGDESNLPEITPGLLDALAASDMLLCEIRYEFTRSGRQYESSRRCVVRQKAYEAVESDFEPPPTELGTRVTVGAIIHTMSGGNVQAVGVAEDARISQVVNDPDLLRSQVEALAKNLLDEVRSALNVDDLAEYAQAVRDLRDLLLAQEPSPSAIRRLVRTVGLLGDIEGSISLMTRVWSILHPLLLIAAARFG